MKLDEFLATCDREGLDVDMYTDYTDELAICYCGDADTLMTEDCRTHFEPIFDLEVEWDFGDGSATVLVNDLPEEEADRMNELLISFFGSAAGYVGETTYRKWFKEV